MDGYPLNLVLAVATASATIFLGFLPTKNIQPAFFERETLKAAVAWVIVAVLSPAQILHYPLVFAFLCFASFWNFKRERALSGKMWLSVASGLGISIGVMLILAVTPKACPPGLPQLNESLLLASIYLGGATLGLAYVCYVLALNAGINSGVTNGSVQRYVGLLLALTFARAVVLFILAAGTSIIKGPSKPYDNALSETANAFRLSSISPEILMLLGLIFLLTVLAFLAWRATRFNSRQLPTRFLVAFILLGFVTEILARFLVL